MRQAIQLAGKDMPMMALLGTLAAAGATGRSSMGHEARRGTQFGYGPLQPWQAQFGGDDMGYNASNVFGADPASAPAPAPMIPHGGDHRPNPHDPRHHGVLMAAWEYQHGRRQHTLRRTALLNPNEHSDVKIEAYVFSLNPSQFAAGTGLVWGVANGWTAFKNPQVAFRAERVFINVKIPGLVYVNTLQAANVNAQIGSIADGFSFSPLAMGTKISLPTLPPQNTMQVTGTWSTVVDTPYNQENYYTLAIDFQGWATVIA